jgi:organic hydroperoxide reductase OsmC/OhrA
MHISAKLTNSKEAHRVTVATANNEKIVAIPGRSQGGSSINGGELLFLSLATCFCNDVYREAARRNMEISSVDVVVAGEFGAEGEPASNITYHVKVVAPGSSDADVVSLIQHVDGVAEIHNTLRQGVKVSLVI